MALKVKTAYLTEILKKYLKDKKTVCKELFLRGVYLSDFKLLGAAFSVSPVEFIRNFKDIFKYRRINRYLSEKYREYYAQLVKEDAVIWGTGEYGKSLFYVLNAFPNIKVRAFTNSFQNEDAVFCDIPLLSPVRALELYPEASFVIASDYAETIKNSVNDENIKSRLIDVGNAFRNFERAFIRYKNAPDIPLALSCLNQYSLLKLTSADVFLN